MADVRDEPRSYPMSRSAECPFDPPPAYREALTAPGLTPLRMWNGEFAWLATRMEDVRFVLSSPAFSAEPARPGYPQISEALGSLLINEEPTLVSMDGPAHIRYRRMLAPLFSLVRIERLRPRVEQIVRELVEETKRVGPPIDFYEQFALVIPSLVISELLGVPYEDHDLFQESARARMDLSAGPEVPLEAGVRLGEYLRALIEKRMADGVEADDDLLARLIKDQIVPGKLSVDEAAAMVRLILIAGHETTANVITFGTLALLRNPGQLAELRADPDLVESAVEEILRYTTVPHVNSTRVAVEDVEVGGQLVKAGEGVVAMINAANRDPQAFPEPDTFDMRRTPNEHVTFAYGIHACLGQPLARLELNVTFAILLEELPTLALAAPFESLTYRHDKRAYGVEHLPLTW
jgi:cytochrome P450